MDMVGMIDLQTCIDAVSQVTTDNIIPLALIAGSFAVGFAVIALILVKEYEEKKLMKNFLMKENQLNKYENWKKDRKLSE